MGQIFSTSAELKKNPYESTSTGLLGLMQTQPLLVSNLLIHAEKKHATTEIVSKRCEGDVHRYTYKDLAERARKVANAIEKFQVPRSQRVGTLAWNGYRHMELYFGVSGAGRVLHTLNPRLSPEQLSWIVNDAEDKVLFFDLTFVPLVKAIVSSCPSIQTYVVMCDVEALPKDSGIPNLLSYETLISTESSTYNWPVFDENSACSLCYTSGTTGNPKGVLYSHRSTLLHCFAAALPDNLNLSARDVVLPVVPMFHVNAWGLPYAAAMCGTKLVFPGPSLDGKSVYTLLESEKVTSAAGVPTVWQMLLNYVESENLKFSTLTRTVIGGSACPPAMFQVFEEKYGVQVLHAWGMTETSPLGSACTLKGTQMSLSQEEKKSILLKQGRPPFGVDMKIVDSNGKELPWDGKSSGDLYVRGPWIVSAYFKHVGGNILVDGWFPTGDVACIDQDGFMQITDRSKDVIKSGGEWISSIDIENVAMGHPSVAMAACLGMKHPKWDERPIVVVVKKPNKEVTKEELLNFYSGKVAKWQIPDDVVFVDSIPLGATGKMQKNKLREILKDYKLPSV